VAAPRAELRVERLAAEQSAPRQAAGARRGVLQAEWQWAAAEQSVPRLAA
jgi:hypothetical protein